MQWQDEARENAQKQSLLNAVIFEQRVSTILLHSMNFAWKFIFSNVSFCARFPLFFVKWHFMTSSHDQAKCFIGIWRSSLIVTSCYFFFLLLPFALTATRFVQLQFAFLFIIQMISTLGRMVTKLSDYLCSVPKMYNFTWLQILTYPTCWLQADECNQVDCGKRIFFAFASCRIL